MTTYVAVFALVLAYLAVVGAYFALRTLAKLRRTTALLARGARGAGVDPSAPPEATAAPQVPAVPVTPATPVTPVASAPGGLRNIALVRYDAFGELSGRLSFSLALLDEHGDGVTLSAIAGRADTRVYAKGVVGGKGEHELSPEEAQAVSSALAKRRGLLGRKSA